MEHGEVDTFPEPIETGTLEIVTHAGSTITSRAGTAIDTVADIRGTIDGAVSGVRGIVAGDGGDLTIGGSVDARDEAVDLGGFSRVVVEEGGSVVSRSEIFSAAGISTVGGSVTIDGDVSGGFGVTMFGTGSLRVGETGTLVGTGGGASAASMIGNENRATIEGAVSGVSDGLRMRGDDSRVAVGETGTIDVARTGVTIDTEAGNSSDDVVVNDGAVTGGFYGVWFDASDAGGDITARLENSGAITGGLKGVFTDSVGEAVVRNSGTITGETSVGLDLSGSTSSNTINQGTISGAFGFAGANGGVALGQDAWLLNEGTIEGAGTGVQLNATGAFNGSVVHNAGVIASSERAIEVRGANSIHSVNNSGEIIGSVAVGISSGRLSLANTGDISGSVFASGTATIDLFNSLTGTMNGNTTMVGGTVRNAGTISGDLLADGFVRVNNAGTMIGRIEARDGANVTVLNTGEIQNSFGGLALVSVSDGASANLFNDGAFVGSVDFEGNARLFVQNTGTISGSISNFGGASNGRVTIINQGTVSGIVQTGAGDDLVDNSRGTIGPEGFDTSAALIDLGGGADTFFGGAQGELVCGGDGADQFYASAGIDTLDGGEGVDTVYFKGVAGGVTANLNTGGTGLAAADTALIDIENLYGTRFADALGGDAANNLLVGGGGNDTLFAGGGNDRLFGDSGNDTLLGGGGNDALDGGSGADRLDGGGGTDIADYRSERTAISANLNTGGNTQGDTYISIESVYGGAGNDALGGNGADNVLFGAGGNDVLFASGGNDDLYGGTGDDTLLGGGGADTFFLREGEGVDTITDFQDGTDLIDVSAFGFTDTAASNDVTSQATVTQIGANVRIVFATGEGIVLDDTTAAQVSDADFVI